MSMRQSTNKDYFNDKKESNFMKIKKEGKLKIQLASNSSLKAEGFKRKKHVNSATLKVKRDRTLSKIEEDKNDILDSKFQVDSSQKNPSCYREEENKEIKHYLEDFK